MINLLLFLFLYFFTSITHTLTQSIADKPKVTIITSFYIRAEDVEFVEEFFKDIIQQTIFNESEWIIIDPNSPQNVETYVLEHTKQYPNIRYIKLDHDPGIYGVWNIAIQMANADYISNANVDDRRNPEFLEISVNALDENPSIDLVYGYYFITNKPHETFAQNSSTMFANVTEFSLKNMHLCLPGPQPTWRKSMHERYGYFDESYKSLGDHEMWLRAVANGAQFKRIEHFSGLYFLNPIGLSTDQDPHKASIRNNEMKRIVSTYRYIWS